MVSDMLPTSLMISQLNEFFWSFFSQFTGLVFHDCVTTDVASGLGVDIDDATWLVNVALVSKCWEVP